MWTLTMVWAAILVGFLIGAAWAGLRRPGGDKEVER